MHILNNCSGVVREHVDEIFGDTLSFDEKGELCTLIYYPREKIDLVRSRREDSPTWYKTMLDQLIVVARSLSSRYTRSKVRKAIPRDYAYIIDELLHTHPDENNYRVRYHERIIESILETASADDFIESLASLIKRLAVDHLHLVGDHLRPWRRCRPRFMDPPAHLSFARYSVGQPRSAVDGRCGR